MPRPARTFIKALTNAALVLAIGASHAYGQTAPPTPPPSETVGQFVGSQPPATLADPLTVPHANGDTSNLTRMWGDPAGLEQTGRQTASGSEMGGLLGQSAQSVNGQVSANDDWLQRSWEVTRGPGAFSGELVTAPSTTCETRTVQDVRETVSTYTCETGQAVNEATCTSTYVPVFDTDYVYECKTGTVWTNTPASCTKRRIVVVDEDYVYGCQTSWSGGVQTRSAGCAANSQPGCQSGGTTCTQPSNLPQSYSCPEGYVQGSSTHYCEVTQNVTFQNAYGFSAFTFQAQGQWGAVTSLWAPFGCTPYNLVDENMSFNGQPGGYLWTRYDLRCSQPINTGSTDWYEHSDNWMLVEPGTGGPNPTGTYPRYPYQTHLLKGGGSVLRSDAGEQTTTTCGPYQDQGCQLGSLVCVEGAGTRTIDGVAVYRDCWKWSRSAVCSTNQTAGGCSVPAGMTLSSETCGGYTNGTCTLFNRTYTDPSGGCAQSMQTVRCENSVPQAGAPVDTPRDVVSDTWSNDCTALAGNGSCSRVGSTTTEGAATRTINGLPVTRYSWAIQEDYICSSSSTVDSCALFTACTLETNLCASTDRNGVCTAWNRRYRCEENKGNNAPPVATPTDQVGGSFQDNACPQRTDPACRQSANDVCTQAGGTRTVNGNQATVSCWEQTDTFQCQSPNKTSNCQPPAGCTLKRQECLNEGQTLSACTAVENVYECRTTVSTPREETSCTTTVCVGQECYDKPAGGGEEKTEHDMPDALAALYVANEAGKDYSADVSIFKGQPLRCRKAVLGFMNCCKDSGWGVDMGLAQCDDQERTLMQRQQAKAVHYVGTYCDKDSLFGCVVKGMRYCAFEGSLARIVQVEGRKQIAKPWGSGKAPDCSGFTVEQFQQLDLSDVDFSEFTDEMMKKVLAPGENGTVSRIQDSINRMMGAGTPGNTTPPALPGGGG